MKNARLTVLIALLGLALSATASAKKSEKTAEEAKGNPYFEKLKSLAGTWTGKGVMEGQEQTMQTKFRVTSGGTAVEEVLFPGTPHEMVDMYYMDGNDLMMVHYCAMGNQPRMKMTSWGGGKLDFTYVDGTNIPSPDAPHMSGVTLTVKGKDRLVEDWSSTGKEEAKKMSSFVFSREQ